jgi:hypothetical protein
VLRGCPDLTRDHVIRYNAKMRSRLGSAFLDLDRLDLNARILARNPVEGLPPRTSQRVELLGNFAGQRGWNGRRHGGGWQNA